jgi:D-alanyl-lipoteichoic acid acyltransferase DltB (MBOAT superfamily)
LALASLVIYGSWDYRYLPLLLLSIVFNYTAGVVIGTRSGALRKRVLILAVSANLLLLGYFKYADFFLLSAKSLTGLPLDVWGIVLPIGISFFTFTQIAFLVDTYQGKVREYKFVHYLLFVTYFPHLIAGPILHHAVMLPQFAASGFGRLGARDLQAGLAIFAVGLAKKVLLADQAAEFVGPVFDAAADPRLSSQDAWVGALAYTFQIYFDFSGYSDMAIGLARMMGVTLPENFRSPYKASNIIEFWRRWHISLSNFLRDYLYVPLGGNRKGLARRYGNVFITMLLGGLWHGASWTFVLWGGLHGLFLVINHGWRHLSRRTGYGIPAPIAWLLTMLAVVGAWVFFRASSTEAAVALLRCMLGLQPALEAGRAVGFDSLRAWSTIACCAAVALALPNTWQWRERLAQASAGSRVLWLSLGVLVAATLLLVLMAESAVSRSAFIYFNF